MQPPLGAQLVPSRAAWLIVLLQTLDTFNRNWRRGEGGPVHVTCEDKAADTCPIFGPPPQVVCTILRGIHTDAKGQSDQLHMHPTCSVFLQKVKVENFISENSQLSEDGEIANCFRSHFGSSVLIADQVPHIVLSLT